MTRKLIYTPDAAGEYTIAEESENWVTDIGQVENESDARLFCAAPDMLAVLQSIVELQTRGYIVLGEKYTAAMNDAITKALG